MSLDIVYDELEIQLLDKLQTNFNEVGFKKLQHVDLFNDQFQMLMQGEEEAFDFPAILVDFNDILWDDIGEFSQQGDSLIRFHVGQHLQDHTKHKSQALKYLNFVHRTLHGFTGSIFNRLVRRRTVLDISHGGVIVHIMEYTGKVFDDTADPSKNWPGVIVDADTPHGSINRPTDPSPYIIPG